MCGVLISYLLEHPEYVPQLAQWLFEQWDSILGEKTPETRIKKLNAHMNRDQLPIAWVDSWITDAERCIGQRIDGRAGWGAALDEAAFLRLIRPGRAFQDHHRPGQRRRHTREQRDVQGGLVQRDRSDAVADGGSVVVEETGQARLPPCQRVLVKNGDLRISWCAVPRGGLP